MIRVLWVLMLFTTSTTGLAKSSQKTVDLLEFTSAESAHRLERSQHKVDFFHLVNVWEPQMNPGMCGPTSAVIVLNALRLNNEKIKKPRDQSAIPKAVAEKMPKHMDPYFDRYTQRAWFDGRVEKVKSQGRFYGKPDAKGKRDPGLQLRQLHQMLLAHGLSSEIHVVTTQKDNALRDLMAKNLKQGGDYVVVNYHRKKLGQPGGGHISPVGAYDQKSDSFLVLDTNPNRARWVWVSAGDLIAAMRTKDIIENRGFLLIKEGINKATSQ